MYVAKDILWRMIFCMWRMIICMWRMIMIYVAAAQGCLASVCGERGYSSCVMHITHMDPRIWTREAVDIGRGQRRQPLIYGPEKRLILDGDSAGNR